MLEKRVGNDGHIYAKLTSLSQWEKNPRDIYDNDALHLKILIATLGLFKPLFVTTDGKMVGGNMRLPSIKWLNENILEWDDSNGVHQTVDKRGKLDEVWVTVLDFVKTEDGKVHASLDGVIQDKVFESDEQAMVEYSTADNSPAGYYVQDKTNELFKAHIGHMDMTPLKMNLAPPVTMKTFMDQYIPSGDPPNLDKNKKKEKSKEVVVQIKYTPKDFAEIEPRIQRLKTYFELENITDLFNLMLERTEAGMPEGTLE